jgi:hypothetical protein
MPIAISNVVDLYAGSRTVKMVLALQNVETNCMCLAFPFSSPTHKTELSRDRQLLEGYISNFTCSLIFVQNSRLASFCGQRSSYTMT